VLGAGVPAGVLVSKLLGGPLDGAFIAMDDYELEYVHTAVELVEVPPGQDYEAVKISVRHVYRRNFAGGDLHYQQGD